MPPANAVAATLTTTMGIADAEILYTADTPGALGNNITVEYVDPGVINSALSVSVTNTAIVVSLETDGAGAMISTGAQVTAAVNANAAAAALVTAADTGTGAGVIAAAKAVESLAGGANGTPAVEGAMSTDGNRIYISTATAGPENDSWRRTPVAAETEAY